MTNTTKRVYVYVPPEDREKGILGRLRGFSGLDAISFATSHEKEITRALRDEKIALRNVAQAQEQARLLARLKDGS
jgi:hypothetical protein